MHQYVCDYLKLQYPGILFRTDMGGVRLTMSQAVAAKRTQAGRAWPDIFIAAPRGALHGMFLELKREGERVYLKNGGLSTDAHIREQATVLSALRDLGYYAEFAVGFDDARTQIDTYLKIKDFSPN